MGEAGNVISKSCAGQATKNMLMDGSAEPMEKRQMDEVQKRDMFRRIQNKNLYIYVENK